MLETCFRWVRDLKSGTSFRVSIGLITDEVSPINMQTGRIPALLYAAVAGAALLAASVLAVYFFRFYGPLGDQAQFGQFGDFVGGILNPLLSFVTLIAVLWSLRVQLRELDASHLALAQSQELHREQLELQRNESIRSQLKQDAELYFDEYERLFRSPIFRLPTQGEPFGEPVSLHDLIKNPTYLGLDSTDSILGSLPEALTKSDSLSVHLNTLRKQTAFLVYSVCSLIQRLDVDALRLSWRMRTTSLITDMRAIQLFSEQEANEFEVSLVGAITLAESSKRTASS